MNCQHTRTSTVKSVMLRATGSGGREAADLHCPLPKYGAQRVLAAVVGVERAAQMLQSKKNVHLFITGKMRAGWTGNVVLAWCGMPDTLSPLDHLIAHKEGLPAGRGARQHLLRHFFLFSGHASLKGSMWTRFCTT